MRRKKKAIKIKITLHRIYVYYKQLLHIIYFTFKFENTSYLVVNNYNLVNTLDTTNIFSDFLLKAQFFKFNINVYKYLRKQKLFKLPLLNNFCFLFNFNYIIQIPTNIVIDLIFLDRILSLNSGVTQYIYLKIPQFKNLISIQFYKDFLAECDLNEVHFKLVR